MLLLARLLGRHQRVRVAKQRASQPLGAFRYRHVYVSHVLLVTVSEARITGHEQVYVYLRITDFYDNPLRAVHVHLEGTVGAGGLLSGDEPPVGLGDHRRVLHLAGGARGQPTAHVATLHGP